MKNRFRNAHSMRAGQGAFCFSQYVAKTDKHIQDLISRKLSIYFTAQLKYIYIFLAGVKRLPLRIASASDRVREKIELN